MLPGWPIHICPRHLSPLSCLGRWLLFAFHLVNNFYDTIKYPIICICYDDKTKYHNNKHLLRFFNLLESCKMELFPMTFGERRKEEKKKTDQL
jgi:hypothetical protein